MSRTDTCQSLGMLSSFVLLFTGLIAISLFRRIHGFRYQPITFFPSNPDRHAIGTYSDCRRHFMVRPCTVLFGETTRRPTEQASWKNDEEKENNNEVDDAYRLAREKDSTWFDMFITDILGSDGSPLANIPASPNVGLQNDYESNEKGTKSVGREKNDVKSAQSDGLGMLQIDSSSPEDIEDKILKKVPYTFDAQTSRKRLDSNHTSPGFESQPKKASLDRTSDNGEVGQSKSRYFVQYFDVYNHKQTIPLQLMSKLGYATNEITALKAISLEIIVKDGIRRPRGGVPSYWKIRSGAERQTKVIKGDDFDQGKIFEVGAANEVRTPLGVGGNSTRRKKVRREFIAGASRKSQGNTGENREFVDNGAPKNQFRRTYSNDQELVGTGIWMDLDTFRGFLRKEASFRLSILGPDWSDAVKGESRWRYKMYKSWLDALYSTASGEGVSKRRERSTLSMDESKYRGLKDKRVTPRERRKQYREKK